MLKKRFKVLMIILVMVFVTFATNFALAANETSENTNNEEIETTSTNETEDSTAPETKSLDGKDKYISGDDVVVSDMVDGNLFVKANKVTIDCEVGGDAFILAKEVEVTEKGYIYSNLFTLSDDVKVKGIVYDLYAATNNATISGYVYRDIKVAANNKVSILGTIGRNAFIYNSSDITFTDPESNTSNEGSISGKLEYTSSKESVSNDIQNVGNGVTYHKQVSTSKDGKSQNTFTIYLTKLVTILILLAIVWLVSCALAPKFTQNAGKILAKKPVPSVLLGIVATIAIPIISVILIALKFSALAGLVLLIAYILLLVISNSIFTISVNDIICDKFKVKNNSGKFLYLLIVGVVFWLIGLIPTVGGIFTILTSVLGLGIITAHIFTSKKTKQTTTK